MRVWVCVIWHKQVWVYQSLFTSYWCCIIHHSKLSIIRQTFYRAHWSCGLGIQTGHRRDSLPLLLMSVASTRRIQRLEITWCLRAANLRSLICTHVWHLRWEDSKTETSSFPTWLGFLIAWRLTALGTSYMMAQDFKQEFQLMRWRPQCLLWLRLGSHTALVTNNKQIQIHGQRSETPPLKVGMARF